MAESSSNDFDVPEEIRKSFEECGILILGAGTDLSDLVASEDTKMLFHDLDCREA